MYVIGKAEDNPNSRGVVAIWSHCGLLIRFVGRQESEDDRHGANRLRFSPHYCIVIHVNHCTQEISSPHPSIQRLLYNTCVVLY